MIEALPSVGQYYIGSLLPTLVGSVFIWARLYTRTFMTRNLGADDALIFAAWVSAIILAITSLQFPSISRPPVDATQSHPDDVIQTLKVAYASRLIYQLCLVLTKLSIAVFYLRIFQDRTSRYLVYAMMGFIVVSFLPVELAVIFLCTPVQGFWHLTDRHCLPENPSIYANAILNIVADVLMMAFVFPRIINLKMALRQKISLLIILSLGFIVIVATIVRLNASVKGFVNSYWSGFDILTWSAVEIAVGFFCACAPCVRPLLRQIAPHCLRSFLSSTSATEARSRPKSTSNWPGTILSGTSAKTDKAFGLGSIGQPNFQRTGQMESSMSKGGCFGVKRKGEASGSDTGSERQIRVAQGTGELRGANEGEIVKTVSVTINNEVMLRSASEEDLEMGRGSGIGMVKFEHV